jgi:hypothetical protein
MHQGEMLLQQNLKSVHGYIRAPFEGQHMVPSMIYLDPILKRAIRKVSNWARLETEETGLTFVVVTMLRSLGTSFVVTDRRARTTDHRRWSP